MGGGGLCLSTVPAVLEIVLEPDSFDLSDEREVLGFVAEGVLRDCLHCLSVFLHL
jgi:hypothetical protein